MPPEALTLAMTIRLAEELLAAIQMWELARGKVDHMYRGALEDEMQGFGASLSELCDGIAQLGGVAPTEPDRELCRAVDDVDGAGNERGLRVILTRARERLLNTCARIEVCQQVPAQTESAVRRLKISLRRIASSSGHPGEHDPA